MYDTNLCYFLNIQVQVTFSAAVVFFSWLWFFYAVDFGSDVEAAPLPTVESASTEITENNDDDVDEVEEEGSSKEKKKRTGFRDRKVE